MTRPEATVVIACHTQDRLEALERAVASVRDQTLVPARTVVVVDHNPAFHEFLRTRLVGVDLLENGSAPGASGARNTGAAVAMTPVVAFLDDDERAHPEWLEALLRPFDDPSVIGTGGHVEPEWLSPRPRWFPEGFGWVVGASYRGLPTTQARVRNVWGGNMAVRKTAFDAVEGFRAGFGKAGNVSRPEDTDLCLRMARAVPGGIWVHVPDAVVDHLVPPGRATFDFFLRRCLAEGRGKVEMAAQLGDEPLESERQYLRRTLPRGVVRHVRRAEGVANPLAAAAIVAGVAAAGAGFVQATASARRRRPEARSQLRVEAFPEPDASAPRPAVVCDLEIGAGLGDIGHLRGSAAAQLWGLVRVFQEPVGMVQADWPSEPVTSEALVALVEEQCGPTVRRRLADAGVPVDGPLPTLAVHPPSVPAFLRPLDGEVPSLTVVLCTRDRPEGVAAVLDSLVAQHEPRFDVLVVDNAPSGEDTAQVVARFEGRLAVRRVVEPVAGLSQARNRAVASTGSDLVAWLDDDEVADPWWTREVLRTFLDDPAADAMSGLVLPQALDTPAQLWFEQYGGHSKGRGFAPARFSADGAQSPLYPLPPFGVGANMAFRRAALERIGPFDTALGAGTPAKGAEDTLAFTRLLLAGGVAVYRPTAVVRHTHRRDLAGLAAQMAGYGSGLTAFYTALLLDRPAVILPLLRLLPQALRDLRSTDGVRLGGIGDDFPKELLKVNRRGLLRGPVLYARGRREARRHDAA